MLYQFHGTSFLQYFFFHIWENITQNQIHQVFPYFFMVPMRYLFEFSPGILIFLVILTGAGFYTIFHSRKTHLIPILSALGIWIIAFELSPTVPLGRTIYSLPILAFGIIASNLDLWSYLKRTIPMLILFLLLINFSIPMLYPPRVCKYEYDLPLWNLLKN